MATVSENKRAAALKLTRSARQLRGSVAQDLRVLASSHNSGLTSDQRDMVVRAARLLERTADDLDGLASSLEAHPTQRRGRGV
jgi:hypothetical protein